jgi:hypothetical protein
MEKMKNELKKSRDAFFESVRTLHMAYLRSRIPGASDEDTTEDDAILAALASELGYHTTPVTGTTRLS